MKKDKLKESYKDLFEVLNLIEEIKLSCSDRKNKRHLNAIKRNLKSTIIFLNEVHNLSFLLKSEKEVEWFYDRYKTLKKNIIKR